MLERKSRDRLHTLKEESRKERNAVNVSESKSNKYIALGGRMMSIDSPMLGSVYSRVKKPLRKSLSKYKTINKEKEMWHRGIGIGEGGRENIKGKRT